MGLPYLDGESWMSVVAIRDAGGTLLLVPSSESRTLRELRVQLGSRALDSVTASPMQIDSLLARHQYELGQLRDMLISHHLIGLHNSSGQAVRNYVARSVDDPLGGSLTAIFLPSDQLRWASVPARLPTLPTAEVAPAGTSVRDMSVGQRIFAMFQRMQPYLKADAKKALAETLASLATPEAQLILIGY